MPSKTKSSTDAEIARHASQWTHVAEVKTSHVVHTPLVFLSRIWDPQVTIQVGFAMQVAKTPTYPLMCARCNIYISRLCYDVSVRLSVMEVNWRIIASLGFKFRSKFTAHCRLGDGSSQQHIALC